MMLRRFFSQNSIFFIFLWKFLKFDHSKYKGCYVPLELEFNIDFDFKVPKVFW